MKNPTIIFRVSNACNLNCTYCYDKDNHTPIHLESEKILKEINSIVDNVKKIFVSKEGNNKIIFHGGEPLVVNANVYEKLIRSIKKEIPNVEFSIQTNGTLLSEEHMDLFKKYDVRIGISLDGYNEKLNSCRVYSNGVNSFNTVMEKIKKLKEKNIRFGIIMTLSNQILGHEKELYDFIADNKIRCNIRPAFPCGDTDEWAMTSQQYAKFFNKIFDIWLEHEEEVELTQVRELYEQFKKGLNPSCKIGDCATSGNCFFNFVSLDVNGNVYSCNRTYRNRQFYYGNLADITLEDIREKQKELQKIRKEYIESSKCIKCEMFRDCNGGCPANAYSKHKKIDSADDNFCEAKIAIKKHIREILLKKGIIDEYNKKRIY